MQEATLDVVVGDLSGRPWTIGQGWDSDSSVVPARITTDLGGGARTVGANVDMDAFEYGPTIFLLILRQ